MVAGSLRHLKSLRLMQYDKGWINCLLDEAENERMHLLTFMELRRPGPLFRAVREVGVGGVGGTDCTRTRLAPPPPPPLSFPSFHPRRPCSWPRASCGICTS